MLQINAHRALREDVVAFTRRYMPNLRTLQQRAMQSRRRTNTDPHRRKQQSTPSEPLPPVAAPEEDAATQNEYDGSTALGAAVSVGAAPTADMTALHADFSMMAANGLTMTGFDTLTGMEDFAAAPARAGGGGGADTADGQLAERDTHHFSHLSHAANFDDADVHDGITVEEEFEDEGEMMGGESRGQQGDEDDDGAAPPAKRSAADTGSGRQNPDG